MSSRHLAVNDKSFSGQSVVYVMARDQRVQDNHALHAAQQTAIEHNVPLYVFFALKVLPHRSYEHYAFMLDGLKQVQQELVKLHINLVIRQGGTKVIQEFLQEVGCGSVYFDFSPLPAARRAVRQLAKSFDGSVTVVDTHNIIPVWITSNKQEFAAHTIRRKIHAALERFLEEPGSIIAHPIKSDAPNSLTVDQAMKFAQESTQTSGVTSRFTSGERAARASLDEFIERGLSSYAHDRNDPTKDAQSNLSPYLHFGQLSSLRIALQIIDSVDEVPLLLQQPKMPQAGDTPSDADGMNTLLEELIVRKELSDNFCFYAKDYKQITGAPEWAQKSLASHRDDPREFIYTLAQWEAATTHDDVWNATQNELKTTGKMHGYMRMYWAKKILEWSKSPEEAIETAVYLNDKYSFDGGDPNGYVGILWSIAGLHDRPWFERSVYGKIRYMNDAGLRRKFDVDRYLKKYAGDSKSQP